LELDVAMSILLLAAPMVVVEGWLRRPRRWQLSLSELAGLVFTACVMAGEFYGALNSFNIALKLQVVPSHNFDAAPWWIQAPIYLSAACLVFAAGRASAWLVGQILIGTMIVDPPATQQPSR
jgi:hypothetical protein